MAFQQEPDSLVWCLMGDGRLLTLTYLPGQQICAWARQETQGKVLSLCSLPAAGYDEMWFAVKRGSATCIERLCPRLSTKNPQDQVFLDSCVSVASLGGACEMGGLAHLEGQTVQALADGNPIGPFTVQAGKITLPAGINTVHVGLAYEARLVTLPPELNLADGTSRDRKRRLVSVTFLLADSRGGFAGPEDGKPDELVYAPQTPGSQAPALQSGLCEKIISSSHSRLKGVLFQQPAPLPVTLLNIMVTSC